ncbi:MAG: efflux transporter outer membrane subunit [Gemmataceae bacterium]
MDLTVLRASAKWRRRLVARTMASGLMFAVQACNTPCLRDAQPGPPLPEAFNGMSAGDSSAQLRVDEFFNDPMLVCLIQDAVAGNQDLKILAEDIEIANNEVILRRGAIFPFVTGRVGASVDRHSKYTLEGAVEEQLEYLPGKHFPRPLPDFLVAANVSWEVDIWRKLRNARDAAALRYLATSEGRNYAVTRLVAEVAENYYGLMALDKRLENLDQTIALQEKSLEAAKAKKAAGRDTELPVQRFQAEVRKNQSEKLVVQQEIVEVENHINFLAGRFPQHVERPSANFLDLDVRAVCIGVPAQLLANRPDIRQAEQELMAAGLDIQVARADFFPRLDITGGLGFRAFSPQYLFNPEAFVWNAAGDLVAPLVNRTAIAAAYRTANARQLQAIYSYQRIVLDAFTEVVNRVTKAENYRKSIEIKVQQLASLEASVDAANKLFQNARAEYSEVLFAQRELMEARAGLIELKRQQLSAIVNAYQALGGGSAYSSSTPGPRPDGPPPSLPGPLPPPAADKEKRLPDPPRPAEDRSLPAPREEKPVP